VKTENPSIDIREIINQGLLEDLILGRGTFVAYRPEEGYAYWNKLQDYYDGLSPSDEHKSRIVTTILDLFDRPSENSSSSWFDGGKNLQFVRRIFQTSFKGYYFSLKYKEEHDKRCALTLARVLRIEQIVPKIVASIQNGEFNGWHEWTQHNLLVAATALQIQEVSEFVIQEKIRKNDLASYLLWSDKPSDTDVATQHDLWRLQVLKGIYNKASSEERKSLDEQLMLMSKKYIKIRTIFREYLAKAGNVNPFVESLRNCA
jgi:hypothetical protein